tara:strand:- start:733 stop:951 length:219 start_codon:yes stop_codon:yes gene_type:complete
MSDREIMNSKFKSTRTQEVIKQKQPDAKKHQTVSFIKSAIRIVGYVVIPFSLPVAALILVISEAVGIVEELV